MGKIFKSLLLPFVLFLIFNSIEASHFREPKMNQAFNHREVMQLLQVIDPKTCICRSGPPSNCPLPLPDASRIGLSCPIGSSLCCNRKTTYGPVSSMRETIAEAVKAVRNSGATLISGFPTSFFGGSGGSDTIRVKQAAVNHHNSPPITRPPTRRPEYPITHKPMPKRVCQCVPLDDCKPKNLDFTFGKSCGYGSVRCCSTTVHTHPPPHPHPHPPPRRPLSSNYHPIDTNQKTNFVTPSTPRLISTTTHSPTTTTTSSSQFKLVEDLDFPKKNDESNIGKITVPVRLVPTEEPITEKSSTTTTTTTTTTTLATTTSINPKVFTRHQLPKDNTIQRRRGEAGGPLVSQREHYRHHPRPHHKRPYQKKRPQKIQKHAALPPPVEPREILKKSGNFESPEMALHHQKSGGKHVDEMTMEEHKTAMIYHQNALRRHYEIYQLQAKRREATSPSFLDNIGQLISGSWLFG